jgi:hypothetical protein
MTTENNLSENEENKNSNEVLRKKHQKLQNLRMKAFIMKKQNMKKSTKK